MSGVLNVNYVIRILVIGLCLLVSGCKLDLYTGLSERDANEMLAILMTNGISATKEYKGDEGVTLLVEETELARAIEVLKENGYPRETRISMGKVFEKSGIMSSPFEERIRFIYALGEEVSQTLSEIDGVLTARVHIVLPEDPSLGEEVSPSSAAVFIKHRIDVDLDFFTPQIRRLVSNSIEGVEYENVTVVLVGSERPKIMGDQARSTIATVLPGLGVRASDQQYFWQLLVISGVILAVLVLSNLLTLFAFVRARSARKKIEAGADLQTDIAE
ncbi:type III secretion inner membrane ring lipoprotein SctJ [Roseibium sp.]|uniref:type III secretion system inner membrane ring lipoprotein SctJ n=1 Tax=Roseibium sp. TaxID=1936156 RepID=UPI003266EC23